MDMRQRKRAWCARFGLAGRYGFAGTGFIFGLRYLESRFGQRSPA